MGMETNKMPITPGCHVELNLLDREGNKERLAVDIVSDEMADFSHGFLGVGTPLAKVLLGESAGSTIPYLRDELFAIEIVSVAPSNIKPPDNTQAYRQSVMDKVKREVEHTSAVIFASSFSGKWGDYDPDSLPATENPETEEPEK